jgi:hypothetical protein
MDPRADATTTGEHVAVIVGAAADGKRRVAGPAAWCALEVLATTPPLEDTDAWIVCSSVRSVATRMGVAKNTAQRALAALCEAGLVAPSQRRSGTGEFGSCEYRLNVPADVLSRQLRTSPSGSSETGPSGRVPPKPTVAVKASVEIGQQLVLLPSV